MNEGLENNLTQLNDNWTLYNSSVEYVIPRNNITYVGFYLHQPSTAAIFILSYLLIFLVCMVGNAVVCFIVLRSKNMWTVTNLFILNLAVSDLLVGIFCMPTTLLDNIITGEQDQSQKLCLVMIITVFFDPIQPILHIIQQNVYKTFGFVSPNYRLVLTMSTSKLYLWNTL